MSELPTVSLDDLEMALLWVSNDISIDAAAYVCRRTGKVWQVSSDFDDEDAYDDPDDEDDDAGLARSAEDEARPDDLDDPERYAPVPTKKDLDLGRALVRRFAAQCMPDAASQIEQCFRGRGGYGRFKDLLHRRNRLDQWHAFEDRATVEALTAWARDEGFEVVPR